MSDTPSYDGELTDLRRMLVLAGRPNDGQIISKLSFEPSEDITTRELAEVLAFFVSRMGGIKPISQDEFDQLPEGIKKHFKG